MKIQLRDEHRKSRVQIGEKKEVLRREKRVWCYRTLLSEQLLASRLNQINGQDLVQVL